MSQMKYVMGDEQQCCRDLYRKISSCLQSYKAMLYAFLQIKLL